jgi:hypothetical protein
VSVAVLLCVVHEEVEDRAIVPQTVPARRTPPGNKILAHPVHRLSVVTDALASGLQGAFGDVDDREIGEASPRQLVHKRGRAAADVDDRCTQREREPFDQLERRGSLRFIPADPRYAAGLVHRIPVSAEIGACVTHGSILCDLTVLSVVTEIRLPQTRCYGRGLAALATAGTYRGRPPPIVPTELSSPVARLPGRSVEPPQLYSPRTPTTPAPIPYAETRRHNSTGPHQTGMHVPHVVCVALAALPTVSGWMCASPSVPRTRRRSVNA